MFSWSLDGHFQRDDLLIYMTRGGLGLWGLLKALDDGDLLTKRNVGFGEALDSSVASR